MDATTYPSPSQPSAATLLGLGHETDDLVAALREGLPVEAFNTLQDHLDLSSAALATALRIPPRTLSRRLGAGRFSTGESERILRLARVVARAGELFCTREALTHWLRSPETALGGQAPLEYLDTDVGAREVEDLLGRLLHGVVT